MAITFETIWKFPRCALDILFVSEYTNEVGFWKGGFRVFLKKNLGSGSGFGFSKNEKKIIVYLYKYDLILLQKCSQV